MKKNGNAEDRGAEGAGGVGCGEGVSPPHRERGLGSGLCLPPQKKMILALNMVSLGAFWMVFFTIQLPVLNGYSEFNRYMRIKAVMVSR